MATMEVRDAGGSVVTIEKPLVPGRSNAAGSRPVVLSSEDKAVLDSADTKLGAISGKLNRPGTGTSSSVTSVATDATILAANADRKGATVFNESTATLRLLVAAGTSSATNYTVKLLAGAYYEVPFGYTGVIKGIWDAANGAARVTEFT